MKVLYRISDNSYKKPKIANATKQYCLQNFLTHWPVEEVTVYMDRCVPETQEFLRKYSALTGLRVVPIDAGSSGASWRVVKDEALRLPDDELVYLVEDDYLHLPNSRRVILEGLERADYVALYDHPDKYIPAGKGPNPLITEMGGEHTVVLLTASRHWKVTNSTTMTFACRVGTLREDEGVWAKHTSGDHPLDFHSFVELGQKGRTLITPLPALATHAEPAWLSPLVEWQTV